ncbi:hypothetical protein B0H10DRAFT_2250269, partial [Mycena sp. CBHHK59/15]
FLDKLIRHDGRGEHIDQRVCAGDGCEVEDAPFRCRDCLHSCLYCEGCIVEVHRHVPLHHIQIGMWNRESFEKYTLKQLGHTLGEPCPNPVRSAGDDFVVVGSHMIDKVRLDYCNCTRAKLHPIQLLRMGFYPAIGTNPRSAATFQCLRRFNHVPGVEVLGVQILPQPGMGDRQYGPDAIAGECWI